MTNVTLAWQAPLLQGELTDAQAGKRDARPVGSAGGMANEHVGEAGGPVGDEERQKLSAFADFIESLDLGDLDSGGEPKSDGDDPVADR